MKRIIPYLCALLAGLIAVAICLSRTHRDEPQPTDPSAPSTSAPAEPSAEPSTEPATEPTTEPVTEPTVPPKLGWEESDGKKYYYPEPDTPASGYWEVDGQSFYFLSDGQMAVGKQVIDGNEVFFLRDGSRILLVNEKYAIPDDYAPQIVSIPGTTSNTASHVLPHLQELFAAATAETGFIPAITSSYRTHSKQESLFNNQYQDFIKNYGYTPERAYAATKTMVAVPGHSEHELGLALDVVEISYYTGGQQNTIPLHQWLQANCWKYGFIVRYPADKQSITGVVGEPWHLRYVGAEAAKEMYDLGLCLEEYLDFLSQ